MKRTLLALLMLAGCTKPAPATPDARYRAFAQDVAAAHQGKDRPELLQYFDAATREALTARAEAASKATGNDLPKDPAYQLLLDGSDVPSLAAVTVTAQTGDSATLQVTLDGGARTAVHMVKEQGLWRIHLDALPPAEVDDAPTAPAPTDAGRWPTDAGR